MEDTLILHRIKPRDVFGPIGDDIKIGVITDVETTGLDHAADKVIQLGAVRFAYDGQGRVGAVQRTLDALIDPGRPIPPEITKLTGITDDMVAGKTLDPGAVGEVLDGAAVVIAHNAAFDRKFCEPLDERFRPLCWACSVEQIPWADYSIRSKALDYIAFRYGLFYDAHRALDDCTALLEILSRPIPGGDGATGLKVLLDNARRPMMRVWAIDSPYGLKDGLKAAGYSWSDGSGGRPKAWFKDVPADEAEDEMARLRREFFARPRADRLNVFDRFSERE